MSLFTAFLAFAPLVAGAQGTDPSTPDKAIEVITNSIGMKLARIPAGAFLMGSPETEAEREAQEHPHEVVITAPFYLGVYEVTQREFHKVMGKNRKMRAYFDESRGGSPDHPIENVKFKAVEQFYNTLSNLAAERKAGRRYRLPTEAEWEYACRGASTTPFNSGAALSSKDANFNGQDPFGEALKGPFVRKTLKVGSFKPNPFGLYDMHGNVAEWCSDWYTRDYYKQSPGKDPAGPPRGASDDDFGNSYRVVRGGCWLDDARACRSAYRFRGMLSNRYRWFGFRVVCEVAGGAKKP